MNLVEFNRIKLEKHVVLAHSIIYTQHWDVIKCLKIHKKSKINIRKNISVFRDEQTIQGKPLSNYKNNGPRILGGDKV